MATRDHTSEQRSVKRKNRRERRIKVCRAHYEHQPKRNTHPLPSRAVPWLQMKGLWLEQAGFDIDTPVRIRVMPGCLVLTTEADGQK